MGTRIIYYIVNFNLWICLVLIAFLTLNSCGRKHKPKRTKTLSPKTKSSKPIEGSFQSRRDSLFLFDLNLTEGHKGDTIGFVSVSDIYSLPGNLYSPADSVTQLVIPDLKNKKPEDTRYLTLTAKYRKRMLAGTGISETDSLFVYDYANDVLLTFPVKSLNVVASLSIYEDATEAMHSAMDYQIGFEINRKSLDGLNGHYFPSAYVYIGAKNPFTKGQMHPIVWKKINPKDIPEVSLDTGSVSELKNYKFNCAYSFESDSFRYYLQQYSKTEQQSTALRLLVINFANDVVFNALYSENESSSPAPISIADSSRNEHEQWTGHLFKNRPPVILGFEYISFGCPILPYLDKSKKFVDLMCDNRH
jgi:hypothetical protein